MEVGNVRAFKPTGAFPLGGERERAAESRRRYIFSLFRFVETSRARSPRNARARARVGMYAKPFDRDEKLTTYPTIKLWSVYRSLSRETRDFFSHPNVSLCETVARDFRARALAHPRPNRERDSTGIGITGRRIEAGPESEIKMDHPLRVNARTVTRAPWNFIGRL